MSKVMDEQQKGQKVYLGLGTLPPSDVWKKLRRFDVKTSVSDLQVILEDLPISTYIIYGDLAAG